MSIDILPVKGGGGITLHQLPRRRWIMWRTWWRITLICFHKKLTWFWSIDRFCLNLSIFSGTRLHCTFDMTETAVTLQTQTYTHNHIHTDIYTHSHIHTLYTHSPHTLYTHTHNWQVALTPCFLPLVRRCIRDTGPVGATWRRCRTTAWSAGEVWAQFALIIDVH